jgi:hypothetical protein
MTEPIKKAFPFITVIPSLMRYELIGPQQLFEFISNPPPTEVVVEEEVEEVKEENSYDSYKIKSKNAKEVAMALEKERDQTLIPSMEDEFRKKQMN